MFVPAMPRGELIGMLRRANRAFQRTQGGAAVKFVGKVGTKVKAMLSSTDL